MKNIFRLLIWFLLLLPVSANAQKHAFEVFTNYVLDFPYDIFLNVQESQLIDILRKKNNYEIGLVLLCQLRNYRENFHIGYRFDCF